MQEMQVLNFIQLFTISMRKKRFSRGFPDLPRGGGSWKIMRHLFLGVGFFMKKYWDIHKKSASKSVFNLKENTNLFMSIINSYPFM